MSTSRSIQSWLTHNWTRRAACAVIWIAAVVEFLRLAGHANYYLDMGMDSDEFLYFGMARGLLNGLKMYEDLFETKPPGIFWLSEISLLMTGDDRAYRLLQTVLLLSIPLIFVGACLRLMKTRSSGIWLACGSSFLFGASLASFTLDRTQGNQTEGFAIVPAFLAVLIPVLWHNQKLPAKWLLAASVCMCMAVLLKEPFALSMFAAALLLVKTKRDGDTLAYPWINCFHRRSSSSQSFVHLRANGFFPAIHPVA